MIRSESLLDDLFRYSLILRLALFVPWRHRLSSFVKDQILNSLRFDLCVLLCLADDVLLLCYFLLCNGIIIRAPHSSHLHGAIYSIAAAHTDFLPRWLLHLILVSGCIDTLQDVWRLTINIIMRLDICHSHRLLFLVRPMVIRWQQVELMAVPSDRFLCVVHQKVFTGFVQFFLLDVADVFHWHLIRE